VFTRKVLDKELRCRVAVNFLGGAADVGALVTVSAPLMP
jgi:hypothetical protein